MAVRLLQRHLRMVLAMRRLEEMIEQNRMEKAAKAIQTCARGWVARRLFAKQLLVEVSTTNKDADKMVPEAETFSPDTADMVEAGSDKETVLRAEISSKDTAEVCWEVVG